jgi:prepilin peptidase CpaA
MDATLLPPLSTVVAFALVAAGFDLWCFKVPNLLTASMVVSGIVYHGVTTGLGGLQSSLLGALFGFGILFFLYLLGGVGAGDMKLMAGAGAWLGPMAAVHLFVIAGLATGVCSVALLVRYGGFRRSLATMQVLMLQLHTVGKHLGAPERVEAVVKSVDRRKRLIPFAVIMAVAAVALLVFQCWSER